MSSEGTKTKKMPSTDTELLLYHCIQNCSGQKINYAAVSAAMGITGNAAGKRYNAFKQKFNPNQVSKEEVLLFHCIQNVNGKKINYNAVGAAMGITGNAAGKRYNALKQRLEAEQSGTASAKPSIPAATTSITKRAMMSKGCNIKPKIKNEHESEKSEEEKRKDLQAVFDEKRKELEASFRAEEAEDERWMVNSSGDEVTILSDTEAMDKPVANQGKKRKAELDSESEISMSEEESEGEDEEFKNVSPPPTTRQTRGRKLDLSAVFESDSSDEKGQGFESESESDDYENERRISTSHKNMDMANKHKNEISVKYIDRSLKNFSRSSLKNEIARANASRSQTKTVLPPTPQSNAKSNSVHNIQPITPITPTTRQQLGARVTVQPFTPAFSVNEQLEAALARSDLNMARQAKSVEMRFAQSPISSSFTPINKRDVPLPSVEKDDEVTPEDVDSETRSLSSISYPPSMYFHDEDEDMDTDGGRGVAEADTADEVMDMDGGSGAAEADTQDSSQVLKGWLGRITGGLFSKKD